MSEPPLLYVAFGFTIALIIAKFLVSILLYRIFQDDKENKLVLGASLVFFSNGISRILMVIFDYFLTRFDSSYYQAYSIFWKIGFGINCLGFLSLIFISEEAILNKKSRYLISVIYATFMIIAFIPQDINVVQFIAIFPSALTMIYIPLSYLYLARYEAIRKRALAIFAGYFIFLLIGSALLAEDLVQFFISLNPSYPLEVRSMIHIISICFKLLGMSLIVYGYRKKST